MNIPVPVNGNAFSLAVADVDGDGKLDLILGCIGSNTVSIYLNTSSPGTISFAASVDFATTQDPYGIAVGDLDGDGKIDIAVADFTPGTVSVFRNTSSPGKISLASRLDLPAGIGPQTVAIGDLDGDGKPDIAVVNSLSSTVSLYRNLSAPGSLSFAPRSDMVTGSDYPFSVSLADIDGDGKADLAISNENLYKVSPATISCFLFHNNSSPGNMSFSLAQNLGTGDVFSLCVGDLNGDGRPDIALPRSYNGLSLYPNTSIPGTISFGNVANYAGPAPFMAAIGDLDGDGLPDVAASNVTAYGFSVWMNQCNKAGISRIFPTIAPTGWPVLITGANLSGSTSVQFGGAPAASFTVLSDTAIKAIVGSGATGAVTVATPKGTASLSGFTFAGVPTISGFSPASAGEGSTVTITGTYLTGTSAIQFGGVNARSIAILTDTSLTAVVDTGASGNIVLATPGGTATRGGFNYIGPTIGSFTPSAGNEGTTITIMGTGFTGTTAVSFGGIPAISFVVVSPTTITAVLGAGGTGNVTVVNNSGQSTRAGFAFTGPTIDSFAPAMAGTGTKITIYGTNFSGTTQVTVAGDAVRFTVVDSSTIVATAVGAYGDSITVRTPLGVASIGGYTYTEQPLITTFSPTSAPLGSTVVITGANFGATPAANIVYLGSVRAPVVSASANTLNITVPPGTSNNVVTVTTNKQTAYADAPLNIAYPGAGAGFAGNSFDGKLDFPVPDQPKDLVLTDFDGDGKTDIVGGGGTDYQFYVLRNTTAGGMISFAPAQIIPATQAPDFFAVGDFDGDGKPDLVVDDAFYLSPQINVFRNTSSAGTITFAPPIGVPAKDGSRVYVCDIDGDGRPDIIMMGSNPYGNITVLQNSSSGGTISFSTPIYLNSPMSGEATIADFDGDGKPDMIVLNGGYLSLFKNYSTPGSPVLKDVEDMPIAGNQLSSISSGDLNGDGKPDLLITDAGGDYDSVYVLANLSRPGTIAFGQRLALVATPNGAAFHATINDMDGDGVNDLVVTNLYGASISVFKGNNLPGVLSFQPRIDYPISPMPWKAFTADMDGDGKPDMVVGDQGMSSVAVFRNLIGAPTTAPSIRATGPPVLCAGDSIQLISSMVSGDQWYKDGQEITGATGDTLSVVGAGSYTVTTDVTRTTSSQSAPFLLTVNPVPDKPVITFDSGRGLISSADTGNQWYMDTTSAITGASGNTYKPSDSGYYSLRVTQNGCSSVFASPYFYHLPVKKDTSAATPTPPLVVSPDPVTTGQLTVVYNLSGVTSVNLQITDLYGRIVLSRTNVISETKLDVSSLAKGAYELVLLSSSGKIEATTSFIRL